MSAEIDRALAAPPKTAARGDMGGMLEKFLETQLVEGIARADDFEQFSRKALTDIMSRLISVESNQKALFAAITPFVNSVTNRA